MSVVCIVGGGLTGLLTAYTLSQKGFVINLFEQSASFFLPNTIRGCTRHDARFLHLLNLLNIPFVVYPSVYEPAIFPYELRLEELRSRPVRSSMTFKELYISTFGEADWSLFKHAVPSPSAYEDADAEWVLFYHRFPHERGHEFDFNVNDLIHALVSTFKNVRMFLNSRVDYIHPTEKIICVNDQTHAYNTLVITSYDVAKHVCPWLAKSVQKVPLYVIDMLDPTPHTNLATVYSSTLLESVVPFDTSSLRILSLNKNILKCSVSTLQAFLKRPSSALIDCKMILREYSILKKHPRSFVDITETVHFLQTPRKDIYVVGSFASLSPNQWEGYMLSMNILNKI